MANRQYALWGMLIILLGLTTPLLAQDNRIILNNNVGTGNALWEIQGERTLVMNGFDLVPTPLQLPVVIENININVFRADPFQLVDVVVYADPNGGSPVDATLVATTKTAFPEQGIATVNFERPVIVESAIVWIGFYMPVGTTFYSDTQGTSVLTYWAWTPDGEFDLSNLGSAQVFGPSDGSVPVNLALGGVARIGAEARTATTSITETYFDRQELAAADPFAYLINYNGCPTLFKDESDVVITYGSQISSTCRELESWHAPRVPSGYTRRTNDRGVVYDLAFYNEFGDIIIGELPEPITHCVTPAINEIDSAVIGIAYGVPRRWEFLPSEKFGVLLCAEVNRGGSVSYFTPN